MHIPDGFLDPLMAGATYLVSTAYLALSARRASAERLALLTTLAAIIFAAQMLNWPIPGGTSLHLVGGALAGTVLGPHMGALAMSLVLLVQCLLFHDGGITALGANILNMAVIDVVVGYAVFRWVRGCVGGRAGTFAGAFLGGWLGMVAAGVACGFEIGLSPAFPYGWTVTVPVMGGWHAALGVVEGLITGSVVAYLESRLPDLLRGVGA